MQRGTLLRAMAGIVTGLIVPAVLLATAQWSRDAALEESASRTRGVLNLYAANLEGYLGKFTALPRILADNPSLRDLLAAPDDEEKRLSANIQLERFNDATGATEAYLMTPDGLTVATSNWADTDSFLGHNFAFRPYFQDAMSGHSGRYFALGTTSLQRGYYFSYPALTASGVIGVAVVKTHLSDFEETWAGSNDIILVTDPDGVVFMSSVPEWIYRPLSALSADLRTRLRDSRRYPRAEQFQALPIDHRRPLDTGGELVRLNPPGHAAQARAAHAGGDGPADYLMMSRPMPRAGWTIHVLSSAAPVSAFVLKNVLLAVLGLALTGVTIFAVLQRMGWYRARIAMEQETTRILAAKEEALRHARDELEVRVRARTTDLRLANQRLRDEIQERERTRDELRRVQDEVAHTGKLAAIGQLAAGITHELNQPLAAMRAYADNAQVFLSRARYDEVAGNLERIASLTERMADISGHLKRFARKARGETSAIPLAPVIAESLDLMGVGGRLRRIEVDNRITDTTLHVRAGRVRLEQIFINLIRNSLEAMHGAEVRRLELDAGPAPGPNGEDGLSITVRDTGHGISPEALDKMFQPFFSTKEQEQGLGLGLSISHGIVENFGGTLSAANHPEGGAVFTLWLQRVSAPAASSSSSTTRTSNHV